MLILSSLSTFKTDSFKTNILLDLYTCFILVEECITQKKRFVNFSLPKSINVQLLTFFKMHFLSYNYKKIISEFLLIYLILWNFVLCKISYLNIFLFFLLHVNLKVKSNC